MSRGRGNKASKAAIAARQAKERKMIEENPNVLGQMTQAEIADAIGAANRLQVQRDLQQISKPLQLENSAAFEQMKHAQLQTYELMERSLIEGKVSPETAREWRGIRSEISQLLGLNAPSKSVHVNVTASQTGRFHKFVQAAAGLSEVQLEKVFQFAASLEREQLTMPAGPPPLMLEVGTQVLVEKTGSAE